MSTWRRKTAFLKTRLQPGWRLSDGERATLAEIGRRLGYKGLEQVACIAKPDTILAWYRKLLAKKFDGSKRRRSPGRPRTTPEIEDLVVRCACENSGGGTTGLWEPGPTWGIRCPRKPWAISCAGTASDPAPQRSKTTTWKNFIRQHTDVLACADFFTVEVLTWRGYLHPPGESQVSIAGITDHPEACWMHQVACNATFEGIGP